MAPAYCVDGAQYSSAMTILWYSITYSGTSTSVVTSFTPGVWIPRICLFELISSSQPETLDEVDLSGDEAGLAKFQLQSKRHSADTGMIQ